MPTSVMIDCVLGAVVALFAYLGWKRGFFRTLAELAVVIVALFLASRIADAAAPEVVDRFLRPATHAAIEQRVDEMMAENISATTPLEELLRVVEGIPNSFIRDQARSLVEGLGLSTAQKAGYAARETLVSLGIQLADSVLDGVVYNLVRSLVYAVSFAALTFLLRLAVRVLNLTTKLPVLRQLNEVCGLLVGVGKGIILTFLGTWILWMAGVLTEEIAEPSFLLRLIVHVLGLAGS